MACHCERSNLFFEVASGCRPCNDNLFLAFTMIYTRMIYTHSIVHGRINDGKKFLYPVHYVVNSKTDRMESEITILSYN